MWGLYVGLGVGALFLALVAVVLVRTLMFVPHVQEKEIAEPVEVNSEKAISDLAAMIRCKTISDFNRENEDEAEFIKFKELLPTIFPNIYASCEFEEVTDRALLYKYKGKKSDTPVVLMSHYDVVSVEEKNWSRPPFEGVIEDGVLWGRGTLDTKGTLNAAMQALEKLIGDGFVPENDIYLAFAGNEEVGGNGAPAIVDLFERRGITPGFVLDEGGAVVEGVFPGVKEPCALVGIAEKGMLNLEFSYEGNGGHASSPKPHTPVGILSAACVEVENHPFDFRLTEATAGLFDVLARHSTFVYRMIFSNLWLFSPVLNMICKKNGGEMNALLRTTCAFTQMEGSKGMNVIPPRAKMVANFRLLPGDTVDSAVERIRKTVNNPDIKLRVIYANNPSVVSTTKNHGWDIISSSIKKTWDNTLVSPYLMVACSDSRHWGRISDKVYRFSTMALSKEERGSIHGNDEKIPFDTVRRSVEFYTRLISSC